jgi:hypothetical protein
MGKKQFFFFEKQKTKLPTQKKTEIFNSPNSQNIFTKISGIGPWVSSID